jgi:hypothetical protein
MKVYGPQTIGLLNALGYPSTNYTPAAIQIKGSDTVLSEGNNSDGAAGVGMNWVLLVVLFLMRI